MRFAACLRPAAVAALLLQGCAGSSQPLPPAGSAPSATGAELPVRVAFKIPHHRQHGRGADFLSPSTGSIVLTVFNSAHTQQLLQRETDTVPGLNGCTAVTNGSFTCPMALSLLAGSYAFDVVAYDNIGGKGSRLSALKNFVKKVVAGKANTIRLTLDGVPVIIDCGFVGTSPLVNGNGTTDFDMAGVGDGAAQRFQLLAEDADGNTIVGSGAPSFALLSDQPSNISIVKVAGTTNQFTLTPQHPTTVRMNLTLEAIAGGSAATPIYGHATLGIDPLVYIANPGNSTVTGFTSWGAGTPAITLPASAGIANPYTVAVDAKGNVYVANFQVSGAKLLVFPPGKTTASRTITGLSAPGFGLAVDASGDIFVTEYVNQDVKEFTPAGGSTPSRTLNATTSPTGIDKPAGLAIDASGNLYVANNAGSIGVSVYAPGTSTTPSKTFHNGMTTPTQLAFDASGNLYVANNGSNSVTEYTPPFSSSSTAAHTFSSANTTTPYSVAVDSSKNVWVGQTSGGNLVEFTSSGTVVRTVPGYSAAIYAIATDASGNAYVTDFNNNAVDEFTPSSGTSPIGAFFTGVSTPADVAVWE